MFRNLFYREENAHINRAPSTYFVPGILWPRYCAYIAHTWLVELVHGAPCNDVAQYSTVQLLWNRLRVEFNRNCLHHLADWRLSCVCARRVRLFCHNAAVCWMKHASTASYAQFTCTAHCTLNFKCNCFCRISAFAHTHTHAAGTQPENLNVSLH